jgi:DnaJ domain
MQPELSHAGQRIRNSLDAQEITVILDATGSPSSRLKARFVAHTAEILRIHVATALGSGITIGVVGDIETSEGRQPLLGQYEVHACIPAGPGRYLVDLAPCVPPEEAPASPPPAGDDLDYYEILQVSRKADTDTIHRVFHVLAQRYHPDNPDTGNIGLFRHLAEAHTILCDREKRAAYDIRLAGDDKTRLRIFESVESSQGVQAEIRKRQGVLRLLYTKRMTDPHNPSLRARDFTEMLSCPKEHLEFCLWFLRDKRLIVRSDNNRFEITSHGVEVFEAADSNFNRTGLLQLPSPSMPAADADTDQPRAVNY